LYNTCMAKTNLASGAHQGTSDSEQDKSRLKSIWDIVYLAVVAEIVLWMDLGAKFLVRNQLRAGEAVDYKVGEQGFVMLVHLPNAGISLGMFKNYNMIITYLGLVAVVVILTYDLVSNQRITLGRFGLALLLGGILGNLIDRIALGYVTDIFMFAGFPVFNIADVCIAVGVAYLIVDLVRKELSR
jgi:signal peptidase II